MEIRRHGEIQGVNSKDLVQFQSYFRHRKFPSLANMWTESLAVVANNPSFKKYSIHTRVDQSKHNILLGEMLAQNICPPHFDTIMDLPSSNRTRSVQDYILQIYSPLRFCRTELDFQMLEVQTQDKLIHELRFAYLQAYSRINARLDPQNFPFFIQVSEPEPSEFHGISVDRYPAVLQRYSDIIVTGARGYQEHRDILSSRTHGHFAGSTSPDQSPLSAVLRQVNELGDYESPYWDENS